MVRDELMQRVIQKDKEPITPFLERARDLYEKAGISTILVVGSCGSYFYIADQIIQMDNYCPVDITEKTRKLLKEYKKPDCKAEGFALPSEKRSISFGSSVVRRKNYRGTGMVEEHEKIKSDGKRKPDAWQRTAGSSLSGAACGSGADPDTGVSSQICKRAVQRQNNRSYGTDGIPDPETGKRRIGSVSGQKEIPAGMAMHEDRRFMRALIASDPGIFESLQKYYKYNLFLK